MLDNLESIQLLNTAIIKTKEKKLDCQYDERLGKLCETTAIEALNKAIVFLSEAEKISRDQAAMVLINTFRELDSIWNDYVMMEGIDRLKTALQNNNNNNNNLN